MGYKSPDMQGLLTSHSRPGRWVGSQQCVRLPRPLGTLPILSFSSRDRVQSPSRLTRVQLEAVERVQHGDPRPNYVAPGESFSLCGPQLTFLYNWEGADRPLHFALAHLRKPQFLRCLPAPSGGDPTVLNSDHGFPSSRILWAN